MSDHSKWICSGLPGLEVTMPIQVNYQYDKEAENIGNYQVFCKADTQELHDISDYISIEDAEYIRMNILDAIKRGEYDE